VTILGPPEVPAEVRELLADGLTERGMRQWWTGRSRYLGGLSAQEVWPNDPERVLAAADAWASGAYL
jgi:hypothetical protein